MNSIQAGIPDLFSLFDVKLLHSGLVLEIVDMDWNQIWILSLISCRKR